MVPARAGVAALGLALIAACGTVPTVQQPASPPGMNVSGTIDRGPSMACPTDEPCDPPPVATFLVFSAPGKEPVTAHVLPDGSFATHLDPGGYTIAAAPPPLRGRVEPAQLRVPASGTVSLRLRIVPSG